MLSFFFFLFWKKPGDFIKKNQTSAAQALKVSSIAQTRPENKDQTQRQQKEKKPNRERKQQLKRRMVIALYCNLKNSLKARSSSALSTVQERKAFRYLYFSKVSNIFSSEQSIDISEALLNEVFYDFEQVFKQLYRNGKK